MWRSAAKVGDGALMGGDMVGRKTPAADIVVIGGGMVGLSFAVAAGRAGFDVLVVDRQAPRTASAVAFDGRASSIAYGSKLALEATGIWPGLAHESQPILDIRVSEGDSLLFLHYDHRDIGAEPLGYMVENRIIRRALYRAVGQCERVKLIAPAAVRGLERQRGAVVAELEDGTRLRARLAVAADGIASPTRTAAGIGTVGWAYDQMGIVCTVRHERDHGGIAHERFLPAGPFAILPLTGRRSSLVWTEHKDLAPAVMALDDRAFNAEMRRRFGDFLGPAETIGPRWNYPLSLFHAERTLAHRLALIGDAAHGMHPIAGQGLNMGLRDAAALAEVLVDAARLGLDIGDAGVLERYQRWRRFDTVVLLAATDALNRLFSNDIAPVRLARDAGLAAVNRIVPLKRFFMRHAGGRLGKLPRLMEGIPL